MSPFLSGALALTFFYSSLFLAVMGTFALIFYCLRLIIQKPENINRPLNASLRQGALLSVMICVGLAFQRLRVLTWWDALLLLMIVLMIEFYFGSRSE